MLYQFEKHNDRKNLYKPHSYQYAKSKDAEIQLKVFGLRHIDGAAARDERPL